MTPNQPPAPPHEQPSTLVERVAVLEEQVRRLAKCCEAHDGKLQDHSPRLERLERTVGEVLARLAALDSRLGRVEARLLIGGGLIYVVVEAAMRIVAGK